MEEKLVLLIDISYLNVESVTSVNNGIILWIITPY